MTSELFRLEWKLMLRARLIASLLAATAVVLAATFAFAAVRRLPD